jgi:amino acid adenylation domain-containing protein
MIGWLATLKAGGAYVPLDIQHPKPRLEHQVKDVKVLITQADLLPQLPITDELVVCLDRDQHELTRENSENPKEVVAPENLAYVVFTSGSSGTPKGVAVEHRCLLNYTHFIIRLLKLDADSDVLKFAFVSSVAADLGNTCIYPALLSGGCLHIVETDLIVDPKGLARYISQNRIDVLKITPSHLAALMISESPQDILPRRHLILGGEALAPRLVKRIRKQANCQIVNHYGPTETTVGSLTLNVDYYERQNMLSNTTVPIGRPIANTQCYILDGAMEPVPVGVAGELYIGGDGVARGYLNRPELTAEKFIADPFRKQPGARLYRTGDLCRYLADGNIEFLGRIDQQVKIRGFRVELGEIEAVLGTHPVIRECVVVAREDGAGEKQLVAYLVAWEAVPTVIDLREHLLKQLPDYMVPAVFVMLEQLPLTPNGKVDRKALPAPTEGHLRAGAEYVVPRTPTEQALAAIWCGLLGLARVGIHDNFFSLGGHSLLATRLMFRVRDMLKVELPVKVLLQAPTVAGLSRAIEQADCEGGGLEMGLVRPPQPTAGEPAVFPVSYNQQQLWIIDQLEPESATYNIALVIRLEGELNPEALAASLNQVVARHEVLRTVFRVEAGEPVQVVLPELRVELPVVVAEDQAVAARLQKEEAGRSFDLERGPLVRAQLLKLGEAEHKLLLTVHHIVFDGWSRDLLLRELIEGYRAICAGHPPQLSALPIQYGDYAAWQRHALRGNALVAQLQFWKDRLGGAVPVLNLPVDRPRPQRQSFRGDQVEMTLPEELENRLHAMSRDEDVTLFMTMLAAFNILLHRYTSADDIIVGTPSVVRNQAETENLIGFFVNVLVLRSDLSGDPSFRQLIRQVRKVCLEAYAHQDVPFEMLVQELRPERRPDRNPFFQVMLNFMSLPDFQCELPGLRIALADADGVQSKFDLTLYVVPSSQGIRLRLVYNADIFAASRMAEMLRQLIRLLEQIATQPDGRISQFTLVTPEARALLPDPTLPLGSEWAGSVVARFSQHAAACPQRLAVVDAHEKWTYLELETRSDQLAQQLAMQGVATGDIVAIYAHRSASLVWALLGVWKVGAAFLILDPAHPATRLIDCLQSANPKAWLQIKAAGQMPELLEDFAAELKCRLELPAKAEAAWLGHGQLDAPGRLDHPIAPDDLAYVAFTSGSTGIPKGILGTHRPLSHFLHWHSTQFKLSKSDRFGMLSGLSHDPLLRDVFTPLWLGATLCIPDPSALWDPERLRKWLVSEQVSSVHLVPSLGQMLVESRQRDMLPSLRHVFFGGEVLRRALIEGIRVLAPSATCVNYYGTTETPQGVGYYSLPDQSTDQLERLPVGKGIQGVQLLVLNSAGKLCGIGEPGQIAVRSPYLAEGYLGDERLTLAKFVVNPYTQQVQDRIYLTGDLGRFLPDGNIELLGRNDAQVKIRGYRIELGEIETALLKHPLVHHAVVVIQDGAPDNPQLAAFVVTGDDPKPTAVQLRAFLSTYLPDYMIPALLVQVAKLPLTPNGKVDRNALSGWHGQDSAASMPAHQVIQPRTLIQLQILLAWQRVLKVDTISMNDNFFDLGGHSLLAIRLVNEINRIPNLRLSMPAFFRDPTIEGIAMTASRTEHDRQEDQLIPLRSGQPGRSLFFLDASMGMCELAQLLDAEISSFATTVPLRNQVIDAAKRNDQRGLPSLEQIAEPHTALIQKHQPTGTCMLVGYSFGGLLAFEVAHQLQKQGRIVERIVLLDSWAAYPAWWKKARMLTMDKFWSSLRFRARYGWSSVRVGLRRYFCQKTVPSLPLRELDLSEAAILPQIGEVSWDVFKRMNWHARSHYQARQLDTQAVLFRAQHAGMEHYYPITNRMGWDGLLKRGLEVVETPGDHFTLLKNPNLQFLAKQLDQRLKQPLE